MFNMAATPNILPPLHSSHHLHLLLLHVTKAGLRQSNATTCDATQPSSCPV